MTNYSDSTVFAPHPRVAYRTIGERFVLVHIETNAMLKLNEVGTAIWGWLDGRDFAAIVTAVCERFAVGEDEARRDAADFIAQLQERGLVEIRGGMTDADPSRAEQPRLSSCEVDSDTFWERLQATSDFPLVAMLCVTERCPLSCGHCYQLRDGSRGRDEELSLAEIEGLLDQLAELGVLRLSITGGEPTLRKDLRQIVAAAWERKFLISLKTSGVLLKPGEIDALRGDGLSTLSVSLYHVDAAAHDRFVGHRGAFDRAVAALGRFRALGGRATVSTVIMGWNADAIGPLKELCAERGWSFVADSKVLLNDGGGGGAPELRADGDEQIVAMRHLPNALQRRPAPRPDGQLCLAGVTSLYVKPNGDVWTCPALPITLGNIREAPLAKIWRESPALERIKRLTWSSDERCLSCEHNRFCQRCPGEAFKEHGDPGRAATLDCAVARAFERIWTAEHGDDPA